MPSALEGTGSACKRDAHSGWLGMLDHPGPAGEDVGRHLCAHRETQSHCWQFQRNAGEASGAAVRNPGGNSCQRGRSLQEGTTLCRENFLFSAPLKCLWRQEVFLFQL